MPVSIVVPCYRSAETLPVLMAQIHEALDGAVEFEVILVVDGSPDTTAIVARRLAASDDRVSTVFLNRNYGQHSALLAGMRRARNGVTVTMDDDLQHLPSEIPKLLDALDEQGVDLVYGTAIVEEHGFFRSAASRAFKAALSASGVPDARSVSAFRAYRTPLRSGFSEVNDTHFNVDVALSWTTSSVATVKVDIRPRAVGPSGYSPGRLLRHAFDMMTGYSEAPLRAVTYLGLACSFLGALLLVFLLISFLVGSTSIAGFTSIASMIALFAGAQMLSIGVLGEYLGRLHSRSTGKPMYVISDDASR